MWDIKNKFAINFKIIGMLTILEKGVPMKNNYSFFILIYFLYF